MPIRTTQTAAAAQFLAQTQSVYSRMAKTQEQLNTGLRISRPSDDPGGTGRVLNYDTELSNLKRYQDNVASSINFLGTADTAIGTIGDAMGEIKRLSLQAANGTNNPADLAGIATTIRQLRDVIRDASNVQFGGQYVFGGTSTQAAPYPAPANAYTGTGNVMSRRIGDNQSVNINVSGETLLGIAAPPAPGNAFDVIDQLATDIAAGNQPAILTGMNNLDVAINRALDVRTQLGATASRLEITRDRLASTEERIMESRSQTAEVDPTEAYLKFNQQQTAYQAALAAGTRMLQTSILDFI